MNALVKSPLASSVAQNKWQHLDRQRQAANLSIVRLCRLADICRQTYYNGLRGQAKRAQDVRKCFQVLRGQKNRVHADIGARAAWAGAAGLVVQMAQCQRHGLTINEVMNYHVKAFHSQRDQTLAFARRVAVYLAVIGFNVHRNRIATAAGLSRGFVGVCCTAIENERDENPQFETFLEWAETVLQGQAPCDALFGSGVAGAGFGDVA